MLNAELSGRVVLAMGGDSAEADVSRIGAEAIYKALKRQKLDVVKADGLSVLIELLQTKSVDRVFNLIHGKDGEDGTIQGLLEAYGIPYTGSNCLGSSLTMDKVKTKRVWMSKGLPTPKFKVIRNESELDNRSLDLDFPVVVKPILEGSSVGVVMVESPDKLLAAAERVREFGHGVMIEEQIIGCEYTVGILNDEALPSIKIIPDEGFYDYQAKYVKGTTQYICPAGLDESAEKGIQDLALEAYRIVGCSGWGRVDLMLDQKGQPWLLEVNTTPGMTEHSLVPKAAAAAGISFDQLVMKILASTVKNHEVES